MGTHAKVLVRLFLTSILVTFVIAGTGAIAGADQSSPHAADSIWIVGKHSAISISADDGATQAGLPRFSHQESGFSVDERTGDIWVSSHNSLQRYSASGELINIIALARGVHANKHYGLIVDSGSQSIWLPTHHRIYRLNMAGELKNSIAVSRETRDLAFDASEARLWVVSGHRITLYGQDEKVYRVVNLDRHVHPRAVAYSANLDEMWVLCDQQVRRYDAGGNLTLTANLGYRVFADKSFGRRHSRHGDHGDGHGSFGFGRVKNMVVDGAGGVWIAGARRLSHIDQSGLLEFSVRPFSTQSPHQHTVDLAANRRDQSIWVASSIGLEHYSVDSTLLEYVPRKRSWGIHHIERLDAYMDLIGPDVSIESPADGAFLNTLTPQLELTYSDIGTGVDTGSIALSADGNDITLDCDAGPDDASCEPAKALDELPQALNVTVSDNAGNISKAANVFVTLDVTKPVINLEQPAPNLVTNEPVLQVQGHVSEAADLYVNEIPVATDTNNHFDTQVSLKEGGDQLLLKATDLAGNSSTRVVQVVLDTVPPTIPAVSLINVQAADDGVGMVMSGASGSVEPGARVTVTNTRTGETVTVMAAEDGAFRANIAAAPGDRLSVSVSDQAGNTSVSAEVDVPGETLPPDPADVAPPVQKGASPDFADRVRFLFDGQNPIQRDAYSSAFRNPQLSVVRGEVETRDGKPLPGVNITVLGHPEYGNTQTRRDGVFDMAVNGGGNIVVQYEKDGYLPVQRTVQTKWGDWFWASDVVMIPPDERVSKIDLTDLSTPFQVARGSEQSDSNGARVARVLFPAGVTASIRKPDGTTEQLSQLDVRATEYTVGSTGPAAMPSELPPTSGYTYAVELTVDQALAQGVETHGVEVSFDHPVIFYLDNFLHFPTGEPVPLGYYDRDSAAWMPSSNGRVIEVLSELNGLAQLDVIGDGKVATASQLSKLNITDDELRELAIIYSPGDSIWREELSHFSTWDSNWPSGPPLDAQLPEPPEVDTDRQNDPKDDDEEDECTGCMISPQMQSVGERLNVPGTNLTLTYRSERARGYAGGSATVKMLHGSVPNELKTIKEQIVVAGKRIVREFDPSDSLHDSFSWDGTDAYGRPVYGNAKAQVAVSYLYPCAYRPAGDTSGYGFSYLPRGAEVIGDYRDCQGFDYQSDSVVSLHSPYKLNPDVAGGWSLNVYHAFSLSSNQLVTGDGGHQPAVADSVLKAVAGQRESGFGGDGDAATNAILANPSDIAVDPAGRIYVADTDNNRIRRIGVDGVIESIAGTGEAGYSGDGGPAEAAKLDHPAGISVDSEGNVYIADTGNNRIRKIDGDGLISTVAGNGDAGYSGDMATAATASLNHPHGLAVGPDGAIYVADTVNNRVRKIGPDGVISTIAGTGKAGYAGDGGMSTAARLNGPYDVSLADDGVLYIADTKNNVIRSVRGDGTISTVIGTGSAGFRGDEVPADTSELSNPKGLSVSDGSIYIADSGNNRVRMMGPDGFIHTVAGKGGQGAATAGVFAFNTDAPNPGAVTILPQGDVVFAVQGLSNRIFQVSNAGLTQNADEITVPSKDGRVLYTFDRSGRQLKTTSALTGAVLYRFGHDSEGRLISITDAFGNETRIERDTSGTATAIVAPFGQVSALDVQGENLVGMTSPAGSTWHMQYADGGLLSQFRSPTGSENTFGYDGKGRLVSDTSSDGFGWQLERKKVKYGYKYGYAVDMTTAEGETTSFSSSPNGFGVGKTYKNTLPGGFIAHRQYARNKDTAFVAPSGVRYAADKSPDPRFGMTSPVSRLSSVEFPSGNQLWEQRTRSVSTHTDGSMDVAEDINRGGLRSHVAYDAANRQWTYTTPEGRSSIMRIDAAERPVYMQIASLAPSRYEYDGAGRITKKTMGSDPESRSYEFAYEESGLARGNLASITDPLGRQFDFSYDADGRLIEKTKPDGASVRYGYDKSGNLTTITLPGGVQHVFDYTSADLQSAYRPPNIAGVQTTTYYHYDRDRRLTGIDKPDGTNLSFTYSDAGKLQAIGTKDGAYQFSYASNSGLLDTLVSPGGESTEYEYDGPTIKQIRWASGPVQGKVSFRYSYKSKLLLNDITVGEPLSGYSTHFYFDNDGLPIQVGSLYMRRAGDTGLLSGTMIGDLNSNVTTDLNYNDFGELKHAAAYYTESCGPLPSFAGSESLIGDNCTPGDTLVFDSQLTRDNLGRIVSRTENVLGEIHEYAYSYDKPGRLIQVKRDGVATESYEYDSHGNRTLATTNGVSREGQYDKQDRLTSYGNTTYSYTENGELKSRSVGGKKATYTYDAFGNLKHVTTMDGKSIDYVIDGEGRRVGKVVNGSPVQGFLYKDKLNPVAELDGDGNVVSYFVYGEKPNVPAYMQKNHETYRIISDRLGSVRLVVDVSTGQIVQRMDYDSFGKVIRDTNPGFQPFGFAGGVYDRDTRLVNFGARDYRPVTGAWVSKDPVRFAGGGNFYEYVLGDPVNNVDPKGLYTFGITFNVTGGAGYGGTVGYNFVIGYDPALQMYTADIQRVVGGGAYAGAGGGFSVAVEASTASNVFELCGFGLQGGGSFGEVGYVEGNVFGAPGYVGISAGGGFGGSATLGNGYVMVTHTSSLIY